MEQLNTPVSSTSASQTFLPPPEIMAAQSAFTAIQSATTTLDDVLDEMIKRHYHVGILGSEAAFANNSLETIANEIGDQDKDRKNALLEIKLLLDDLLDNRVIDALKARVEEDINKEIDHLVEIHVKDHLEQHHIPEAVKTEVQIRKGDLERERRRLHNSESKRANSLLRQRDGNVLLNTIYADDGNGDVSNDFPRTLKDLFDLDATKCKNLATEYKLPGVSESREKNLNLLLRFFGIAYQMVR